jgi:sterol-4alpha-carboxylate 3-dehydrogenase (decarboxylating)
MAPMSKNMESYLVTGGCGLQGTHIIEKLLEKYPGAPIAVMARNPTVNLYPGVKYHRGDITVADDIAQVMSAARPTVVFHCAAQMTVGRKQLPDAVVKAINEGGTRLMLEQSKRAGVKAFVYTSSASVVQKETFKDIRNGDETMPLVEASDPGVMLYPLTKVHLEPASSPQSRCSLLDPRVDCVRNRNGS